MTVFVAVWLLVVLGLAAVGVDGGYWYLQRRQQQNAADMAAVAGAVQVATYVGNGDLQGNGSPYPGTSTTSVASGSKSSPPCTVAGEFQQCIQESAQLVSGANGFTNNQLGADVTVNWPPTSGPYQGYDAVEVIVTKPAPLLLTRFLRAFAGLGQQTIGARAVAAYKTINEKICVLQLNPQGTFSITGSAAIEAPNCTFMADSTQTGGNQSGPNSASFYVNGNTGTGKTATSGTSTSTRNIYAIASMGSCTNCSTATQTAVAYTGASATPDPYANTIGLLGPLFEGSSNLTTGTVNLYQTSASYTDSPAPAASVLPPPGEYYGIKVNNNASLTLAPGLYVIGAGGLDVTSSSNLNCTGCTFILTNGGTATINGGANEVLTAPTSSTTWLSDLASSTTTGTTPFFTAYPQLVSYATDAGTLASYLNGVLMYGDAVGYKPIDASTINGTSTSTFAGALYFPDSSLSLSGNGTIGGTTNPDCLMAVAGDITFIGNNTTGLTTENCSTYYNLPSVYVHYVELVE